MLWCGSEGAAEAVLVSLGLGETHGPPVCVVGVLWSWECEDEGVSCRSKAKGLGESGDGKQPGRRAYAAAVASYIAVCTLCGGAVKVVVCRVSLVLFGGQSKSSQARRHDEEVVRAEPCPSPP